MDKAERLRAIEQALDTVKSPGWAVFIADINALRDSLSDVRLCRDLVAAQAKLQVLDMIVGWPDYLEQQHHRLTEPADESDF